MHANTEALLKRLEASDWFQNVGKQDAGEAIVLPSWQQAIASCRDAKSWGDVAADGLNLLGQRVRGVDVAQYNCWNDIVGRINPIITPLIELKTSAVMSQNGLPKVFLDCVDWDILGACMETEYSDIVPPDFFFGLSRWYIAGHFPCGWRGQWPTGKLIVY